MNMPQHAPACMALPLIEGSYVRMLRVLIPVRARELAESALQAFQCVSKVST